MVQLRFFISAAIVMAISAAPTNNTRIEQRFIKAINEVVKNSNSCVILVDNGRIKLVTPEINAASQLATYRNLLKNKNLVLIKTTYKARSAKDIVEKLSKFIRKHKTFLAYFRPAERNPVKGSITTEITRPVGLLGNLLAGLGIGGDEDGLVSSLLSSLGIQTNVKDINRVEFEG